MSSVVDITAQKQAEAASAIRKCDCSARLASVGEMASTLAHELNQPLMALSNFAVAARALAGRASPEPAGRSAGRHHRAIAAGQRNRAPRVLDQSAARPV
jgi:C4-dicarboxylate-specific signal transduction histidine kinase